MLRTSLLLPLLLFACIFLGSRPPGVDPARLLLKDVNLIDGTGAAAKPHMDLLIENGVIVAIGKNLSGDNASIVTLTGKTIMPALISAHVHVGTLNGTTASAEHYTKPNILRQLKLYQDYGVLQLLVMGTDRPLLFENGFYDSSLNGSLPGARYHSAGFGFAAPGGTPPPVNGMDRVNRPANAEQARRQVDTLAGLHVKTIKMWVDNLGSTTPRLQPEVCRALIDAAHRNGMLAAAHLFYREDARRLVADRLDIIAHSIRDQEVDDALLRDMKARNIIYIPTLALDKFAYSYGDTPPWLNDPFFKQSLEPGTHDMISAPAYRQQMKTSPAYQRSKTAHQVALKNVYRIHKAGILVALGTDSGASAIRAQGFSEHLELELLVEAGLTPLEAITAGTLNAARALRVDRQYGTLEKGKVADLLILYSDPSFSVANTRNIAAVYKAGREVSKGPFAGADVTASGLLQPLYTLPLRSVFFYCRSVASYVDTTVIFRRRLHF
ncbi:amidohydrolase [Chitinophaga lutea]|uniref:Amidohydrolase n=1 Tax=Chitinophaga lutea TaxID=2488634 RepID=A0A3N4PUJ3_9BACT|nr:amidohydrolase family protein [Chitinophaga lutea]RPE12493.1 amidohydrolase [Chitinophaga lutea]